MDDGAASFWARSFAFGPPAARLHLSVDEAFGAGLGGTCWGGGVLLAAHLSTGGLASALSELQHAQQPLTALELGAGVAGLPGLVAAASGAFARVVLAEADADVAEALEGNVAANAGVLAADTELRILRTSWAALPGTLSAHLVLAADVAYGMESDSVAAAALAEALLRCAAPGAVILLAHALRPLREEAAFLTALQARFRVSAVPGTDDAGAGLGVFRLKPRGECAPGETSEWDRP